MNSEGVKTKSLANCTVVAGGAPLSGAGPDEAISIEKVADDITVVEGCDGSPAFSETLTETYKMTISLLATSQSNAIMTALREAKALVPFIYKDENGLDAFFSPKGRISKPPTVKVSNKVETHSWEVMCFNGKLFLGGNT